ncbi:MAG: glycosyltransferase family 2 protein [Thermoanaerobacteraceae bacterium]|nr:glycosyltransferase family 2 protein [Thermoanaerobacteraceae bacterium]
MPKVTVAIPTYNRAHYLKEAIESVLAQTYKDYELLIIDNASTDNTEDVVKIFNDKRIKYIKNETNIGMVNNWNKCLDLAQGEYVIIFHDDDLMKPKLLEEEVKILDNNDDVVVVATNVTLIDENNNILKKKNMNINNDIIFNNKDFIRRIYRENLCLQFPTVIMRLNFINQNNIRFEEEVGPGSDVYLYFKINLLPKKIYLINQSHCYYRVHKEQESFKKSIDAEMKLYDKTTKLLKINNLNDVLPLMKNTLANGIISNLAHRLAYGYINREDFKEYMNRIKEENIWTNNIKFTYKMRLLLSYYCPKIAKILHKLKLRFGK